MTPPKKILWVTIVICLIACISGTLLLDGLPIKVKLGEMQSVTFRDMRRAIVIEDQFRLHQIAAAINAAEWHFESAPTLRDTTLNIRYKDGSVRSLSLTHPNEYTIYHRRFFSFRSRQLDSLVRQLVSSDRTEL